MRKTFLTYLIGIITVATTASAHVPLFDILPLPITPAELAVLPCGSGFILNEFEWRVDYVAETMYNCYDNSAVQDGSGYGWYAIGEGGVGVGTPFTSSRVVRVDSSGNLVTEDIEMVGSALNVPSVFVFQLGGLNAFTLQFGDPSVLVGSFQVAGDLFSSKSCIILVGGTTCNLGLHEVAPTGLTGYTYTDKTGLQAYCVFLDSEWKVIIGDGTCE